MSVSSPLPAALPSSRSSASAAASPAPDGKSAADRDWEALMALDGVRGPRHGGRNAPRTDGER
jgi:hypothetical protein